MEVRRLAIIGTGLIGASVALAATRAGLKEVVGYDPEPQALSAAVARGAVEPGRGWLAEAASAERFDGATWFLTPLAATDPERYRLVHGFVSSLGATPVAVDPVAHDRLVALTSHLPHVLANLLVNQAGANRIDGHDPVAAAGGSLRAMT